MNNKLFLSLSGLIVMSGFTLVPETAYGNCENQDLKLKIWKRGLKLTPAKGPRCLWVGDLTDVDTSFTIDLDPKSGINLENGDVKVVQVDDKPSGCGSNLHLGGDLQNSGENDMVITITGDDVDDNETVCFEIYVEDIGMLDPRARVREQTVQLQNIAAEMNEIIEAYETLIDTDLGTALDGVSLDQYLQDAFDMNEAEARGFVQEYLREQTQ